MSDPLVICRGGRLHRRVYHEAWWLGLLEREAAAGRQLHYANTGRAVEIRVVHAPGRISAGLLLSPARVWEHDGTPDPSPRWPPTLCTFRGCGTRATWRISGESGGDWLACDVHRAGMQKVFGMGQRADWNVETHAL